MRKWIEIILHNGVMKDISRLVLAAMVMGLCGCGSMFQKKPTEIESRAIINELNRVRENPNVNNPMPDIYRSASRRMAVDDGVKVFYFAKNTPVASLVDNIKGLGFKVSQNPATNQLVLHCPDDEQADKALEYLQRVDVPPIQVNIDCLILERFGDVTKDWESTLLIQNLFGTGVTLGEDKYPDPIFPGASLRESKRADFGLDFGWHNDGSDGHQVRMMVDALVSRGYLKILLNPTLETVNGKMAKVEIRDYAPIPKLVTTSATNSYLLTDYQWVADSLQVTPYVYADGAIGLKTSIIIGSKSKPEGVTQVSIITERSIDVAENRIDPGKSLIIGGMRKSENRSVVRGIPFFKDIPIIGVLFSSKDFEEKATEIIFILTPSVSSGGMEYSRMAAQVREKNRPMEPEDSLDSVFSDPLGTDTYTKFVAQEAHKSETERIRAQRETLDADREAQAQRDRADQARRDAESLKAAALKAQQQADQARQRIEQARADTAAARQQTDSQRQHILSLQKDMEQAQQEAIAAAKQAQAASAQAQDAETKAARLEQQAQQARDEAEKARKEIQNIEALQKTLESQQSRDNPAPQAQPSQGPSTPASQPSPQPVQKP